MFCNQCEEAMNGEGCVNVGICGKDEEVSDLQDKLVYAIKNIAKNGEKSEESDKLIVEGLFSTITNVNFDREYFKNMLDKVVKHANITYEQVEENSGRDDDGNEDLNSLKQLLLYGVKGIAAYLHHANVLGYYNEEINDFIRKALSSTLEDKSVGELNSLVMESGKWGVRVMSLLDKANTEKYGNPEPTQVNLSAGDRPGILISGHDLKDMEELLKQTEGKGVDVYTHGEMLPANAYPAFKKYSHFVGNYGNSWWKQQDEFEKFNGPILMTTNCLVKPKDSYKDRLYTTNMVGYDDVKHIESKDFSSIIEHAKQCKPPENLENGTITVGFGHNALEGVSERVINAIKSGDISKFVVMAGCDGRHNEREYYTNFAKQLPQNAVILTAGCAKYRYNKLDLGYIGDVPRVIDAGQCNDSYSLVHIAQKLAEAFEFDDINDLPIEYNIAWYEQKAVIVLLSLLSLGVKNIRLGPKLPAFVSPGVLKVLQDNFGLKGINSVEEDLKEVVH